MAVPQITDYQPADAIELVQMWRESFEHGVGIKDPNPIEHQLTYFLNEVVPASRIRVARDKGHLVAFLASTPQSIAQLYVQVQNIGQGLGTRLVDISKADSMGSLWLFTFAQNDRARRFYEHHGFVEVERESENMYKLEAIKYRWRQSGDA